MSAVVKVLERPKFKTPAIRELETTVEIFGGKFDAVMEYIPGGRDEDPDIQSISLNGTVCDISEFAGRVYDDLLDLCREDDRS